MKVLVVGRITVDALESSYVRALKNRGAIVDSWDMELAIQKYARGGKAGAYLNSFLPVEAWVMKANRELILWIADNCPDIVLIFGTTRVLAGTLGQIKAIRPACKTALIWVDSLLYCFSWCLSAIPVYDLIATYSQSTIEPLRRMGARMVAWVPLGFDPELHPPLTSSAGSLEYSDCDVSFIGNYTPERERIVCRLIGEGIRVKVWGPVEWKRSSTDSNALRKYWQGRPLFGQDFCLAVKSSPLSLNPINPVTYPAANMRFFEVPGCGGVSLSAHSPEMELRFPDRRICYYYNSESEIAGIVRAALRDEAGRKQMAIRGQELVLGSETYVHRASQVLSLLTGRTGATVIETEDYAPQNFS
jgi:hypothetical protein